MNTLFFKSFFVLTSTLFFFTPILNAGEVDNYFAWNNEIQDSSNEFNTEINDEINDALISVNKQWGTPNCEDAAMRIMKKLGSTNYLVVRVGSLNSKLEKWAQENHEVDKYPRQEDSLSEYAANSIYAPALKIFGVPTKLDVVVNVNGVYFGTDKLSHFLGSGFEYYRKYLKYYDENTPTMAEALAVKWGVKMENGIIGLQAVGVFSYADLEANFQGLKMAEDFCRADKPKLQLVGKNWTLVKKIDFRDYVNPNWDESFNRSTYTEKRLSSIKKNVKQFHIYERMHSQWVEDFVENYKKNYIKDYYEKNFLDTSLSSKLLYIAQYFIVNKLDEKKYYEIANLIDLQLMYEEYLKFDDGLDLMLQDDVTLEKLSDVDSTHE